MARVELTPAQVRDIAQAAGVETSDKVHVLAIDPSTGEGVMNILPADDAVIFTGELMHVDNYAKYPGTGTIQATIKKRP